MAGTPIKILLK